VNLRKLLPIICLALLSYASYGQTYFRIEADVSMKTKPTGEKGQLILGRVYYDRTHKKMVYNIRFPENEVWVIQDTAAYTFRDNALVRTDKLNPFIESTIFHKCLEGKLSDFGLRDTYYKVSKVEKQEDLVVTTWEPPANFIFKGSVLTSSKNNLLHGVVVMNEEGSVLSKQIFREYQLVSGLRIPTELVQVVFINEQEVYQTITLSNIKINNVSNEDFYNHPIR
jgi:hypothetical protein